MKIFKNSKVIFIALVLIASLTLGCSAAKSNEPGPEDVGQPSVSQEQETITLATTTSTQDSGLLDVLLPLFKEQYNIEVKVVAVGTGEALELGQRGDADVILVHARKSEDEFVAQGYGVNRKDVMYNDFVIVGPAEDPAVIKGKQSTDAAMKKIMDKKALFISRGDSSGTHKKEISLWEKAGLTPSGSWYVEAGQGMGNTLLMADEKKAYTLADRATFLAQEDKLKLQILVEGDKGLFNPYGVIAVNPEKHQGVKYEEAMKFIEFLVSADTQQVIGEYGKDKYGQPLFVPNAQ